MARPQTLVCWEVSQGGNGICLHVELWSKSPSPWVQNWRKFGDKERSLKGIVTK